MADVAEMRVIIIERMAGCAVDKGRHAGRSGVASEDGSSAPADFLFGQHAQFFGYRLVDARYTAGHPVKEREAS